MSGELTLVNRYKACGGYFSQYTHSSTSTKTTMRFTIYLPPQAEAKPVPVIYFLSGLTCTDENFVQKAFAQKTAAARGVAIVAPDTRWVGQEGEHNLSRIHSGSSLRLRSRCVYSFMAARAAPASRARPSRGTSVPGRAST